MRSDRPPGLSIVHVDRCMTCRYKYRSWARRAPPVYQRSRRVTTPSATCSHELEAHHLNRLFYPVSFHHLTVRDVDE